jgi:hypothetical protein
VNIIVVGAVGGPIEGNQVAMVELVDLPGGDVVGVASLL